MRAGLSTILQTLTPEAASVLNLSIAEAGRRNHGQTTPLHVAATLLASPSGFLRQACIRSHPNSSHPLQCRALELCFSVALERLPTGQATVSGVEPPISNALMAALKRAQAHQRRGCPEQQQQPLLAVKVELEQLIISILDDPSVSRVMREASFSSPAVKATIEQSLNSQPQNINPAPIGLGFRPNSNPVPIPSRNLYLNPRLQQGNSAQSGQQRNDEVIKIRDVLLRSKKKNPILVGESEPEAVIRELLRRIEKGEFGEGPLKSAQVIPIEKEITLDKTQIPTRIKELGALIETRMGNSSGGGIILDLGDLKWLVEQQQPAGLGVPGSGAVHQQVVSEAGRAAVAEMAKLVVRFGDSGRLWLIGTATCETYLRCQVYHPTMENDWDLQAVPIASRSPLPVIFRRPGPHGILSSSVESLSPLKGFPNVTAALSRRASENSDPARRMSCCPQCTDSYEKELAKLVANVYEKSSSEVGSEVVAQSALPQWLQNAKALSGDTKTVDQSQTKDQEMVFKQKSQELQKKWADTCLHLHPNFYHNLGSERVGPASVSMTGLYNPKLLVRQPLQQKLQQMKTLGEALQLNSNPAANQPSERAGSPPRSPVRTDLVLGPTKVSDNTAEKPHKDDVTDFLGCISPESQHTFHGLQVEKFAKVADADSFKKLLKGLMEKVWWQQEAVSAVATTVSQFKLGSGKRRGNGSRGDMWLLFTGPDRVGKKKIASVVSEQFCGTNPVLIISLGSRRSDEELDMNFRGKTVLDRIAEAIRRNPFSVIMLEDIDEADMLVRGNIKRAMDRGRLADSHGREINLGNVIFVLTANWFPDNFKNLADGRVLDENKLASIATGGWQLRLSTGERRAKRRADWLYDESRPTKPRKDIGSGLSFDLNLAAEVEDDRTDGSHNSSDLTIEQEDDHGPENSRFLITSVPYDLASSVDETIVFKPVQIVPIRRDIKRTITERFSGIVDGENLLIEFEESALEKILAGVWLGRTSLDEWLDKALVPSFQQLKACLPSAMSADETVVVRLESDGNSGSRAAGDWLPSKVTVKVDT